MDVKAILIVGGRNLPQNAEKQSETLAGIPIAFLDVLGMPVLERVVQRLQQFGVSATAVVSDAPNEAAAPARRPTLRRAVKWIPTSGGTLWEAAEGAFLEFAESGAEIVLALRIGPYVEVDYDELIQHHLDQHCRITNAVDDQGVPLDLFVLTASRRNDASALFRSELQKVRAECKPYRVNRYINRLRDAEELRRLGLDALIQKNALRPVGTERKPGIWLGRGARIHHQARVVAPAFVGARSKIRASALITRGSIVEHHAEVDCGTVVESSTVLPYTYLGAGLDVMHSVVGFGRLNHLLRGAEVEISDPRLIGTAATTPISRALGSTLTLFALLPKVCRMIFGRSRHQPALELPESLDRERGALETAVQDAPGMSGSGTAEFPDHFVAVRRYGDQ